MTDLRTAAQQALEVEADRRRKALAAEMRAALAQQAEPVEPVAWLNKKISFDEAMRLKDQMPKGLFRRVDGQAADEIWLCAIEVAELHHGIPRKESSPEQRTNDFEEWPREKLITLINGIMKLLLWITVGLWAITLTIWLVSWLMK